MRLTLNILFLSLSFTGAAQTYSFKLPNGSVQNLQQVYDNPEAISRAFLVATPVSFASFGGSSSICFAFGSKLRLTKNLRVSSEFMSSYTAKEPIAEIEYLNVRPVYVNTQLEFHLWSTSKIKNRTLNLARQPGDYELDPNYTVQVPRKSLRSADLNPGYAFLKHPLGTEIPGGTAYKTYFISSQSMSMLTLTFSLNNQENFCLKTGESLHTYWSKSRLYGGIQYGFSPTPSLIQKYYHKQLEDHFHGTVPTHLPDDINLKFNPIGFKIGWDKIFGQINSKRGLLIGFECGIMPSHGINESEESISSEYFIFKLGGAFGTHQ